MNILLLLATAAADPAATDSTAIVVTAAREAIPRAESAASVTELGPLLIERLGEPLVPDLLRLAPSVSVSASGPSGTFTQVRIRGAEANQTLLFVDGIKVNDLSFGDEPRFELLNADLASRIEVVRGPQSALWGSQAIGGVIAVDGTAPGWTGVTALGEGGSFGTLRGSLAGGMSADNLSVGGALGWQRARGIDMFGGGDRDGYRNLAGRAYARWDMAPALTLTLNGFGLSGRNDYDGDDPYTFADTHALVSHTAMEAGRVALDYGGAGDGLKVKLAASLFGARNRNRFEGDEINRASGRRLTGSAQVSYDFETGRARHDLTAAIEVEREHFKVSDIVYGGASNQDSRRNHHSLTAEWRMTAGRFTSDVAVRRDQFSKFGDSTSLRLGLLARLGGGWSLAGSYGEGIAAPTFTELYGFFPGTFVGNPDLNPEESRGVEGSIRYAASRVDASLTVYRQRLRDEITTLFLPDFTSTAINLDERSKRWGVEVEGAFRVSDRLRLTGHYTYLESREPDGAGGTRRELRRPRHSAALALDGTSGRFVYGASLALTGQRDDQDFDVFPALDVSLRSYWLADARLAYRVADKVELFVRGSNLANARYQEVFGYRTEGRGLFAGIRLAGRRSSR